MNVEPMPMNPAPRHTPSWPSSLESGGRCRAALPPAMDRPFRRVDYTEGQSLNQSQAKIMAVWLLRLLAAWAFCSWAAATELQLYTEENPPLNFSRDGQVDGLSVEVVRELLRRTGDSGTIYMVPWARGYMRAQGTI